MTLTILSKNKFRETLSWNFKNYKALWIMPIVSLIGFISIVSYNFYLSFPLSTQVDLLRDMTQEVVTTQMLFAVLLATILFFLTGKMYNYLFSKQKTDFFHALPISRNVLLLSRYVASLISAGCYYFGSCLYLIAARPFAHKNHLDYSLKGILLSSLFFFLVTVVLMTLYTLAAVSSGKSFHYLIFGLGMTAVAFFGVNSIINLPSTFLAGYTYKFRFLDSILSMDNVTNFYRNISADNLKVYVCLLLLIAVFLLISLKIYEKRNSEIAQQTVSSRLPIVLTALGVQVITFSAMSSILYGLLNKNFFLCFALSAVTAIIATIILELVITKCKSFKPMVIQLAVFCCAMGALMGITCGGAFGYEKNIPSTDQIESIDYTLTSQYSGTIWGLPGIWFDGMRNHVSLTFHDEDTFEKVTDFHKKAVELFNDHTMKCDNYQAASITYHLKDGTSITRKYPIIYYRDGDENYYINEGVSPENHIYPEYSALLSTNEYIVGSDTFFKIDKNKIVSCSANNSVSISGDSYDALAQAVKKDLQENIGLSKMYTVASIGIQFESDQKDYLPDVYSYNDKYQVYEFHVYSTYRHTIQFLIEHGVLDAPLDMSRVSPSDINKIYFWKVQPEDSEYYARGSYDTYFPMSDSVINVLLNSYPLILSPSDNIMFEGTDSVPVIQDTLNSVDLSQDTKAQFANAGDGFFIYFAHRDPYSDTQAVSKIYFIPQKDVPASLNALCDSFNYK